MVLLLFVYLGLCDLVRETLELFNGVLARYFNGRMGNVDVAALWGGGNEEVGSGSVGMLKGRECLW